MSTKQIIEDTLKEFMEQDHGTASEPKQAITLWVPLSYRQKYEELQNKSKRKFAKCLQEIVKPAIDKVI